MEVYYKERQKQIKFYTKQIKKHAKNGQMDQLSQAKKEYIKLMLQSSFKRELYQKEDDYLQDLAKHIREKENKFIELKLDLCYDLKAGLKEFDEYENAILQMKRQYDKMLSQKKQRELLEEKTKKSKEDERKAKLENYPFLELEDKKVAYLELEEQVIKNNTRKVIAYEIENKELEYRLTQLYQPWIDVKITI